MRLQRRHEPRQPRRPARLGPRARAGEPVYWRRTVEPFPSRGAAAGLLPSPASRPEPPRPRTRSTPWGSRRPVLGPVFAPGRARGPRALPLALRLKFLRVEQLVWHVSPRMDAGRVRALAFHERRRGGERPRRGAGRVRGVRGRGESPRRRHRPRRRDHPAPPPPSPRSSSRCSDPPDATARGASTRAFPRLAPRTRAPSDAFTPRASRLFKHSRERPARQTRAPSRRRPPHLIVAPNAGTVRLLPHFIWALFPLGPGGGAPTRES